MLDGPGPVLVRSAPLEPPRLELGWSARLIIRTALPSDRPGFVEVLLAAFPELFQRAFGAQTEQARDALLRVASEPLPDELLWVAALDNDIAGIMQLATPRTPGIEALRLLSLLSGHIGFWQSLWATMLLNPFLSTPAENGLYLNYIAIHPDYQRQRLGRALLGRAIELTMYEGLPQTMTWLPAGNAAALRLHESLGFGIRKTWRSSRLQYLLGEGTWHYYTRPAAIPVTTLRPVVETVPAP